jgi:hypothetical protein
VEAACFFLFFSFIFDAVGELGGGLKISEFWSFFWWKGKKGEGID